MTDFWSARTGRERLLIIALALICTAYAALVGVWQPALRHRAALLDDITRYARTATVLADAVAAGATFVMPATDVPLPTIITDTAAIHHLRIRRLQPTADAAEITLEDATFDTVLLWIEALENQHGLRILALTMTRRPEPGQVATTLTIGR